MIKVETIQLLEGFGNEIPRKGEYSRALKMFRGDNGIVAGRTFYQLSGGSGLPGINKLVKGKGYGYTVNANNLGDYILAAGASDNRIFQSWLGVFGVEAVYRVLGQSWFGSGFVVDQKNRLLYPGWQYLGMFDPTVANYYTGSVQVTNGSTAVVGTGTTFVAGDVGKVFRIVGEDGVTDFYRISAFTDATHVTLASAYTGTTGSGKSYVIYRAWSDTWKDFGSTITGDTPCEIYEDTVLFGRNNNITSLNVLTNTITTDAVPAFTTPSGFTSKSIVANTTGIILGWNFQGKGILMLWDNYSDRSIAPWIRLDDALLGVYRSGAGWVVMTSKAIYFTNGYSLQLLVDRFLGSSDTLISGPTQDNGVVLGNQLYFVMGWDGRKRRSGVYKMDLKTLLVEFYGNLSGNQYDGSTLAMLYSPDFGRLFTASTSTLEYLITAAQTSETYSYATEEIGQGQNLKVAEGIKLPLSMGRAFPTNVQKYSFTIEAKINTLDRPLFAQSTVKTTSADLNKITVDESSTFNRPIAQVGDEVEFAKGGVSGANNSQIRTITAITGSGTATAVYTLDSDLPSLAQTSDIFILSGFKSIEKKVYTDLSALPEVYFDIKNRPKAKSFIIKFVITNCNIPLEIQPFQFIYDDLGPLQ